MYVLLNYIYIHKLYRYNMYYIYIYIYICIYNIKSQNITKLDFKDVLSFHYKGYIYTYTHIQYT